MPMPTSAARRRAVAVLAAGAAAASSAVLLTPATSSASSHREAPYTSTDSSADNTDTYAFVSPDDKGQVTLIANWSPFQEPGGGPNFFPWDTSATYDLNVDNDGDAKPDVVYRWTFADVDARGAVDRGLGNGGKGTFLHNDGAIQTLDDPDLRFRQTYDLTVLREDKAGVLRPSLLLDDAKAVPDNVGTASVPNYPALRAAGVTELPGGGVAWAGQADDPFFLDLRIFDLLYGGDLTATGNDTLEGYNVNTIALKVPAPRLVANSNPGLNPVIGVWSTTSRAGNRVFAATNSAPTTGATDSSDTTRDSGSLVQVSRLGNPLVNEAVVPANLKDYFNRSTPDRDGQFLAKVQDPEVPALVEALYQIPNPNELGGPAAKRNDLSAAFLTGFSRDVFAGRTFSGLGAGVLDADLNSLDLNAVSPRPVPAEYLRLNVMVPPTAVENPAGVLGGDLAGFPNGRRLGDDVVDIALRVLEGVLVRPDGATKTAVAGLGDGVSSNDKAFLSTFPYVADAHSGSDTE